MHRLLVALLSAFDAALSAAVALATALAALTVLWVFGIGSPDWSALWPAAASVWQLGNLVPLTITLPDAYLVQTGIGTDAASFTLSLAPLAFAAFTAIFAARSGARAARAGTWITGALSGTAVYALVAAGVALTSHNAVARPVLWQAVLFPALLHGVALLVGAVVTAWQDGDDGFIDGLRDRVDAWRGDWSAVPGLAVRGAAATVAGLVGVSALVLAVALVARGGEIIALYEAGRVDGLGASLVTLGELLYLPTLIVWAMSWIAGPGFALGPGTAVSPAGTQLGVVPGIPVLGAIPESLSPWLLLVLLLPVGVGALAGWIVRSRLVAQGSESSHGGAPHDEQVGPRVVLAVAIAALSGGVAALLALAASGSLGPGRLAAVGPAPGQVALAVGLEVLVGAAILLLSPRRSSQPDDAAEENRPTRGLLDAETPRLDRSSSAHDSPVASDLDATAPVEPIDPSALGSGRPAPLPPID